MNMNANHEQTRHLWSRTAATLLLATLYVTANAAETGLSELTYGAGKTFRTDLSDAHLLGQLNIPGKEPILFFSGRTTVQCSVPACDSASSVYHEWAADGPNMWSGTFLHYPGDYYDSDSQRLLAHVKMFLGQCLDSREVAVWFTEAVDDNAAQRDSMLRTRAEVDFVLDLPNMPMPESPMLGTQFPDHLDISVARSAVAKHICRGSTKREKTLYNVDRVRGAATAVQNRLQQSYSR